jgi:peptide/nickel transport system substrate-binding protein
MRMSRRWQMTLTATALAATLGLAGCGSGPENSAAATPGTPTQGGTLTILAGGGMASWDPGSATGSLPGVAWDGLYAVYGTLVNVDADGKLQPGLAEDLSTTDGGKTWTLKLREDLTFTDGTAFDAEAVKFNWDRIADPDNALAGLAVASTFTTSVADPLTLTLKPAAANPVLDLQIAESIPFIASPTALEDQGKNYTKPVGAGPFTLESWDQNVGETLKANPDYYEADRPYVDTLAIKVVTDPAQRVSTVVQGDAQIMNGYPFQFVADKDNPSVGTFSVESGGIRHLVFNTASGPMADVRMRQAVARIVDPTEMVQTLTQDSSAQGSTGLFPSSSPYHDAGLAAPAAAPAEAQKLVDSVKAEGGSTEIKVLIAAVPELVRAGELLQLSLQKLNGVTVKVEQIPIPDWRAKAYDQDDFDITLYPGIFDLNSAPVGMSNLFGKGGSDNFANFDDADMNAALEKARTATSDADKTAAFAEIQKLYVEKLPILVYGTDARTFLHGSDVAGFTSMGRGALQTEELHFTESK